jgi:hypothetical protein
MFEPEFQKDAEQSRSRAILWVGAAATLVLIALVVILVWSRPENRPVLPNVLRAGAPEYDSYRDKVELEVIEKITHPNLIGMFQLEVRAKIHNRGDRTLTGVEVIGKMFDLSDKVIAQNTSVPIPRIRTQPLKPGESMDFSVKVDSPSKVTEDDIKDITIELHGLQFQ